MPKPSGTSVILRKPLRPAALASACRARLSPLCTLYFFAGPSEPLELAELCCWRRVFITAFESGTWLERVSVSGADCLPASAVAREPGDGEELGDCCPVLMPLLELVVVELVAVVEVASGAEDLGEACGDGAGLVGSAALGPSTANVRPPSSTSSKSPWSSP